MCSMDNEIRVPTIDLRGLDPANPGGKSWDSARSEVMKALACYGCFEAMYDGVSRELKEELFGRAVPELFELPLATKTKAISDVSYEGYMGYEGYQGVGVQDAGNSESVERFASLLWPQGNPNFCNTVWNYAKKMTALELIVERMVFQGLIVEKYYDTHAASLSHGIRLAECGVPLDQENKIALAAHVDPNFVTIICQHHAEGLEVQTKDGEWTHVECLPNSYTVMIGEAFGVFSNGRLLPPYHRVKVLGNQKRYSVMLGSRPKVGLMVRTPEELVDEEHPLLYKPYNYGEYMQFRYSEEGRRVKDALKAFSEVGREEGEAHS